jgi:hypothetical protein
MMESVLEFCGASERRRRVTSDALSAACMCVAIDIVYAYYNNIAGTFHTQKDAAAAVAASPRVRRRCTLALKVKMIV